VLDYHGTSWKEGAVSLELSLDISLLNVSVNLQISFAQSWSYKQNGKQSKTSLNKRTLVIIPF